MQHGGIDVFERGHDATAPQPTTIPDRGLDQHARTVGTLPSIALDRLRFPDFLATTDDTPREREPAEVANATALARPAGGLLATPPRFGPRGAAAVDPDHEDSPGPGDAPGDHPVAPDHVPMPPIPAEPSMGHGAAIQPRAGLPADAVFVVRRRHMAVAAACAASVVIAASLALLQAG